MPPADPATMLSALAHPARLRLLAAIAEAGDGGCRLDDLRGHPQDDKQLRRHLARLMSAELVEADGNTLSARLDRMRQAPDAAPADQPAQISAYFKSGRLVDMPRSQITRRAVLVEIARRFEPGRDYTEAEVNALLRVAHDDHAALRRYMVDFAILTRDTRGTAYRVLSGDAEPDGKNGPA